MPRATTPILLLLLLCSYTALSSSLPSLTLYTSTRAARSDTSVEAAAEEDLKSGLKWAPFRQESALLSQGYDEWGPAQGVGLRFRKSSMKDSPIVVCAAQHQKPIKTADGKRFEFRFACDKSGHADQHRFQKWGWGGGGGGNNWHGYPVYWNAHGAVHNSFLNARSAFQ